MFSVMAINWLQLFLSVFVIQECLNFLWTITDMKLFESDEIMCENKQIVD